MLNRVWRDAVCGVVVLLSVCALPAAAAELDTALDESITVEFLDTPLGTALDRLQRETGVNLVIDPKHAKGIEKNPITLKLGDTPTRDALDLMCLMSGAGWDVVNGVVFVTAADEMRRRRLETRVFDIRGLLVSVQNQVGPALDLTGALSNTNSGGGGGRQSKSGGGGGGGGGIFGDSGGSVENMMTRAERIGSIIGLIEESVGELDLWDAHGGDFSVREINGTLVVRATPEVHEEVAELLRALDQQAGQMVQVQSEFYVLPRQVLEGVLAENGGALVVGPDGLAGLTAAIRDGASSRLAATRNIGFNGQRVYVYAGRDREFVSDLEPIPDTTGADPTLSVLSDGVVLDVLPTLVREGREAVVAIKSDLVPTASELRPIADGSEAFGPLSVVQAVERDTLQYRTTVRIPVGGAVLLAGSSSRLSGVDADDGEVVLLLRVDAVR